MDVQHEAWAGHSRFPAGMPEANGTGLISHRAGHHKFVHAFDCICQFEMRNK